VIGHTRVRQSLEKALPTGTLLTGPASIGKWTLAVHLAQHHQVHAVDHWQVPHGLTIDTVRLITAFARRAPVGSFKLITARLDTASHPALHALLKTLEEPPPKVRYLFTSSTPVLDTVASRCEVYELGHLSEDELIAIYRSQGLASGRATRAARHAQGQVQRGYHADTVNQHRNQAVTLAKALATGDKALFDAVFTGWDAHSSEMLHILLTESLTHRWRTFTTADAHGLDRQRPRLLRIVASLGLLAAARPRLGVRAALEPFLARR
jgi:hypothetical protein